MKKSKGGVTHGRERLAKLAPEEREKAKAVIKKLLKPRWLRTNRDGDTLH
jgi:hypothetical protein